MKRLPLLLLALAACASPRPRFYPNERYKRVGEDQANREADECRAEAKQYLKDHPLAPVAKHTTMGAVTGAAIGAAIGLVTGDLKRAVEEGAAAGGAGGAVSGVAEANSPDAVERAYVNRCLAERGYEVIGWR